MDLEDLKRNIFNNINEAQLPIDSVYYLMKDITIEIQQAYDKYLLTKYEQQKKKENNEEDEKGEE